VLDQLEVIVCLLLMFVSCRDSLAGELLQEREDVARSRARAQAAVEALQAANATLEDVPSELAATMASVQVRA
jgi:hypothetical protein